ncbi:MAG: pyridoxal phosphate-dependent aminotransferase [Candidatus Omnitrophica bacterium]|nr:pyridoxal phosphate-dependent aminotransferase [Candidatus Omnitrophota bacterium]
MAINIMFANRTEWSLGQNQIALLLEKLQTSGISILDLTESNPTKCQFVYPQKEILAALTHPKNLEYHPHSFGLPEARQAVCHYYQKKGLYVDPSDVILTSSTSEGYSFLFQLLANVDDVVLSPRPSYPLFSFLGDLHNTQLHPYDFFYRDAWHLDQEGLRETLEEVPNIKAMVMVNPNNPTGSFIKPDELKVINDLAQRYSFALISDEVFLDYSLDGKSTASMSLIANHANLTFVLSGLSKILGLPQMKLSWIVVNGPTEIKKAALQRLEVIADTYLSVNTPVQNATKEWMQLAPALQGQILQRVQANWKFLKEDFAKTRQSQLLHTEGGWYAMISLSQNTGEEELTLRLLRDAHVLVHPGYFFDCLEGANIILSLLPPQEVFQEGINRLLQKI